MRDEEFERLLQSDLSWRKKEISDLYLISKTNNNETLLKSMILILYAHWEGYIKKSSKLYLKYVSEKKIHIKELNVNFRAIVLKTQAKQCLEEEGFTLSREVDFMNKYVKMLDKKFNIGIDPNNDFDSDIINTHHNLKPKVFKNIISIVGLEYNQALQTREVYINSHLLGNRNTIGHGSQFSKEKQVDFDLKIQDVEKLKRFILIILDYYCDSLLNYVTNQYYLISNNVEMKTYNEEMEAKLQKKFEELEDSYMDTSD